MGEVDEEVFYNLFFNKNSIQVMELILKWNW